MPASLSRMLRSSLTVFLIAAVAGTATAAPLPQLKVSENKRFLVTADGKPFFYLGDTAWELFHRLNREDAEKYLKDRAAKGYTVIQAVVLAELDGLTDPNPYGQLPLNGNDPTKQNEKYFEHVDWVVNKAAEHGLYVGMLPTWGDKWHSKDKAIFTPENAAIYGEWLGKRYKDKPIIWVLGGDRPVETDKHKEIIRAMAKGLKKGDGGTHLCTFHPPGGGGSSTWFHADDWLDFNMRQNGHQAEFTGRYDKTRADYDRTPTKPVIDGEPIYEDHPVSFKAKELGHSTAADVRRPLYWDLFTGACGHTYGHHSVWQMYAKARKPINNPLVLWDEALNQPGAGQMQYGRRLIESRPVLTRIPDDSVIVPDTVTTSVPGAGTRRFVATRDEGGTFAMVYAPIGRPFDVAMGKITGAKVKAWWFNPQDGKATPIGTFPNTGTKRFTPPDAGELLDWVLVLDDEAKGYPEPGKKFRSLPLCLIVALPLPAADWPAFRGDGHGISTEIGLPLTWSATVNVVWKAAVSGEGWSSPVVVGNRVYVTTATDGGKSGRVLAFAVDTGKPVWDKEARKIDVKNAHKRNSQATPTPAADSEREYVAFGDGAVASVKADTGEVAWTNADFPYYSQHGLGSSPVLYKDTVIIAFDGSSEGPDKLVGWQKPWEKALLVAFDKSTGKVRWKAGRGKSRIGHATPLVVSHDGKDVLVSPAGDVIQGFDPATGKLLWTVRTEGEGLVPSAAAADGLVFATTGFGKPTLKAVKLGGADDVTATNVAWEEKKLVSMMPSMVAADGRLFVVTDKGDAACLDAKTGKAVWQERLGGSFSASPVLADGKLYVLSDKGETFVLKAGDEYELQAKNPLGEDTQCSPAVSGGRLFLRTKSHLWCVAEKK